MNHSSSLNLPSLGIRSLRYALVGWCTDVQSESKTWLYTFQISRNLRQSSECQKKCTRNLFSHYYQDYYDPLCRVQTHKHARTRPLSFFLAPWQQISIFIPLNLIHRGGRGRKPGRPSKRGDRQHAKRQLTPSKRRFVRTDDRSGAAAAAGEEGEGEEDVFIASE